MERNARFYLIDDPDYGWVVADSAPLGKWMQLFDDPVDAERYRDALNARRSRPMPRYP